jgi:excisionase family DNA binding protein
MSKRRKALLVAAEVSRQQAQILEALADEELAPPPAPSPAEDKHLLTINQTAERLGMSRTWVYTQINSGDLPTIQLGGRTRIRPDDLDAFIREREL